jgi:hypothetical protein
MYKCSSLVITVGRHVILWNPYGPSQVCGRSARHGACSHVRAHKSDQGAPADHLEHRELVLCTRGEKSETGLAPRTRERMVVCQLVFYKNIDRKETPDKHVRLTERKNICIIEIIKV